MSKGWLNALVYNGQRLFTCSTRIIAMASTGGQPPLSPRLRLSFPYKRPLVAHSPRTRPYLTAKIIGPQGKIFHSGAVVDPGAEITVFWLDVAGKIDIALSPTPPNNSTKRFLLWRGTRHQLHFGEVEMRLQDANGRYLQWRTTIGFCDAPLPYGLIGDVGGLEFIDATFRLGDQEFDLTPNNRFNGSQGVGSS